LLVGGYLTLLFRVAAVCDIEIDDVVYGVPLFLLAINSVNPNTEVSVGGL